MIQCYLNRWVISVCLLTSLSTNLSVYSSPISQNTQNQSPPLENKEPASCKEGARPMRVTIRHIEPNGIGYNQGYTTLEGFFAFTNESSYLPFLDVRGHLFNNAQPAANAGFGVRYLGTSRIWGINSYYDYRKTNHQHYNQVSVGLESLGKVWDARLNGYLPVGKKTSALYGSAKFSYFQGHYLYIARHQEFAMKGANAEVGAHVDSIKNVPLYFAAGPYYLEGQGKVAWGGQARVEIDITDYVKIEGNTSYDNVFKWIGQGQLSINIPFGKRKTCKIDPQNSCLALSHRAVQRVDRSEIIPVDHRRRNVAAIDPATGKPWFFWFVNNTSSSLGTFESPFPTLVQAQNASMPNQVIYVFPGDGTTKGMDAGITLQNAQMLLGASVTHPLSTTTGPIIIPPFASTMPHITNISGNAVTLASNNTVSGFTITAEFTNNSNISGGISGMEMTNFIADRNAFDTPIDNTNGISLLNPSGQILVSNCSFNNFTDQNFSGNGNGNGIYIELNANHTLDSLRVASSYFNNITYISGSVGGTGILVEGSGTINTLDSSGNIYSNLTNGVGIFNNGATIGTLSSSGDRFSDLFESSGIANNSKIDTLNLSDNIFQDLVSSRGIYNNGPINVFSLSANRFTDLLSSIGIESFSTINTFSSSSNSFSAFESSFGVNNIGTIHAFSSSGDRFIGLDNSTGINTVGTIGTFSSLSNSFTGLSTSNGISIDGSVSTFISSANKFTGLTNSNGILNNDATSTLNILGNRFTGLANHSFGIISASNGTDSSINISSNTFIGLDNIDVGYAANVEVDGGTICLNFTNNSAVPTDNPVPYQFLQISPGVFNRTAGSGPETNIGLFDIASGVGAEGTCSE